MHSSSLFIDAWNVEAITFLTIHSNEEASQMRMTSEGGPLYCMPEKCMNRGVHLDMNRDSTPARKR